MNNQFQLKHTNIQNLKNFKKALRLSIVYIVAYKYQCLHILDMFTTVANEAKSVSMCFKKHFYF